MEPRPEALDVGSEALDIGSKATSIGSEVLDIGEFGVEDIDTMIIDCDRCEVRGDACPDCVISVLLGAPPAVEWDDDEQRAVDALADAGMVPRLQLVPMTPVSCRSVKHRRPA
jgi:hypothetical protein